MKILIKAIDYVLPGVFNVFSRRFNQDKVMERFREFQPVHFTNGYTEEDFRELVRLNRSRQELVSKSMADSARSLLFSVTVATAIMGTMTKGVLSGELKIPGFTSAFLYGATFFFLWSAWVALKVLSFSSGPIPLWNIPSKVTDQGIVIIKPNQMRELSDLYTANIVWNEMVEARGDRLRAAMRSTGIAIVLLFLFMVLAIGGYDLISNACISIISSGDQQ